MARSRPRAPMKNPSSKMTLSRGVNVRCSPETTSSSSGVRHRIATSTSLAASSNDSRVAAPNTNVPSSHIRQRRSSHFLRWYNTASARGRPGTEEPIHTLRGDIALRVPSEAEGCIAPSTGSDVVVQHELPGVGPQADLVDLVEALVVDPRLDEVVGEHPARLQEVVVPFQ